MNSIFPWKKYTVLLICFMKVGLEMASRFQSWRDSSFSDTCTFQVWVDLVYEQSKEDGNTSLYSSMVNARGLLSEFTLDLVR